MRQRAAVHLLLILILATGSCAEAPASDAVVEQLRIRLVVQPDGSIDVTETFSVRAFTPPASFERRLRRSRVDRFADVQAVVIDPPGQPAAVIDVGRRGDVRVRWAEIAGEQGRTLQLKYRMIGALEIHGTRAWIRHAVLPLDPACPVAEAAVEVELPAAATVVDVPAIGDSAWTVVQSASGAIAKRSGITHGESAVLSAVLDIRALTMLLPVWQQNADRAREMAPAFLIGAFFILVIGAGAVIMVQVQYPRHRTVEGVRSSVRQVASGLLVTSAVVLVIAAAAGAGAAFAIERYGRSVAAIPASILIVGLILLGAGMYLRVRRT